MPIDQITLVLWARMLVQRSTQAFSETDRARVVWTDVARQSLHLPYLKGPITHRDSCFECVPLAFGLNVKLPSKFRLRETRTLIDLYLPNALFGLSKLD